MPILNIQSRSDRNVAPDAALAGFGPTIPVLVGVAPVAEGNGTAEFQGEQALALIDTGASTSCIAEDFATRLGLTPIDRQKIGGVGGKKEHLIYLGVILIPSLNAQKKAGFVGVELPGAQPVLLGRDFLHGCVLIYNGPTGMITIST